MVPRPDPSAALAALQARWGAAAPRRGLEQGGSGIVHGALAIAPEPDSLPVAPSAPTREIIPTGFAALDAILGTGGVPRHVPTALRGDHSSGKTTLALRIVAEAQAGGALVAYLDLARSLDPVEAVSRGVRLEWLIVLTPADLDEGLAMAGALLQGRSVDMLLVDLPAHAGGPGRSQPGGRSAGRPREGRERDGHSPNRRPVPTTDRVLRLAALARRSETLLMVLEPPELGAGLRDALGEAAGLRLELARQSWIRLGGDIVGQQTEVVVARNRFGPPGRRADLRILYAEGGLRDRCLEHPDLLEVPMRMVSRIRPA
jgi:recombination protein RecA